MERLYPFPAGRYNTLGGINVGGSTRSQAEAGSRQTEHDDLQAEVARLQTEIEELKRRLPRHSVPPAMLMELEDLEEKLDRVREAAKNAQGYGSRRSHQV